MLPNLKKGAMFGLDARIALAIFGALSVISGAALYSAIQNSKATKLHTTAKEIEKAFEAMYLDTGSFDLLTSGFDQYQPNAWMLIHEISGINNWKGPYYKMEDSTNWWMKSSGFYTNSFTGFISSRNSIACAPSGGHTAPGDLRDFYYIYFTTFDADVLDITDGFPGVPLPVCLVDYQQAIAVHNLFDNDNDLNNGRVVVAQNPDDPTKALIGIKTDIPSYKP